MRGKQHGRELDANNIGPTGVSVSVIDNLRSSITSTRPFIPRGPIKWPLSGKGR